MKEQTTIEEDFKNPNSQMHKDIADRIKKILDGKSTAEKNKMMANRKAMADVSIDAEHLAKNMWRMTTKQVYQKLMKHPQGKLFFLCWLTTLMEQTRQKSISEKQTKVASAKHKRHREWQQMVFRWCDKNLHKYKSKRDAARAIAATNPKVICVDTETIYRWVLKYKK